MTKLSNEIKLLLFKKFKKNCNTIYLRDYHEIISLVRIFSYLGEIMFFLKNEQNIVVEWHKVSNRLGVFEQFFPVLEITFTPFFLREIICSSI